MRTITSINPSTYEILGEVEISTEKYITSQVQSAHDARGAWRTLGLEQRIKLLRVLIEKIDIRKDELAMLAAKEMGMPIVQARADLADGLHFFKWYCDHATESLSPEIINQDDKSLQTVFHEPIGVAAVITPWNFPFSNFVWGVGQNLVVGNTVVYKTSEECPLFTKLLEEVSGDANLPRGVLSYLYGDGTVGERLVRSEVDIICFTGSTDVGKRLYQIGGEKFIKVVCELGGSAPGIVFADADLDEAIESIYANRFTNSGQMCDALKRLIVHKDVFEEVVQRLTEKLGKIIVGDAIEEKTEIGPLVAKRQVELLQSQLDDASKSGANIIPVGSLRNTLNGAYFLPTLVTSITPSMRIWREEVFGPLLPIISFNTDEEAVQLANNTVYGLGSYVYTKDREKALYVASQIQSGMVSVNGQSYIHPSCPFGGYKNSGFGREHGKYGFMELTQVKVVSVPR